jgi:dolichyl-phosphate beta-glucosyltransferase
MSNHGPPEISLIIPAYREADRLEASVRALRDYLALVDWSHEVIIVVEKSPDDTLELARRLAAGQAAFTVLPQVVQRGKGFAVRQGMLAARGEIAFFMDADLSTPLPTIGAFLAHFAAHPETSVVVGNRQHAQSRIVRRQNLARQKMGQIFNALLRTMTGLRLLDTQCGFKAFRRPARDAIFSRQRLDGFAFDVEVLLLAEKFGLRVDDLPVEWSNADGSKVHLIRDSWRMLRDTWSTRRMLADVDDSKRE